MNKLIYQLLLFAFSFALYAYFSSTANTSLHNEYNTTNGVFLDGYDVVSYLTEQQAQRGNQQFQLEYKGVRYYFTSAAHQVLFQEDPEKFIPQYGGWCAFAMGIKGEKVEVNPEVFKLTNGKVYLFYKTLITNTLDMWNKEEEQLLIAADTYWSKSMYMGEETKVTTTK